MTNEEIRSEAARLVKAIGPNKAGREMGVSRDTVLSLAAGALVMPATFALIREHVKSLKNWRSGK